MLTLSFADGMRLLSGLRNVESTELSIMRKGKKEKTLEKTKQQQILRISIKMDSPSSKPKKIMIQNKDTTLKMRINGRRTPIETKKAIIKIKENILKNCC